MSDDRNIDNIIDLYLTFLDGDGPEPDLSELRGDGRIVVERRLALLLEGYGVDSAPTDDPVLARMGFDRVGSTVEIDGRKLRRARQQAGLDLNTVVAYAHNAGSQLERGDLFRLEQATRTSVTQADATALVAALSSSLHDLESDSSQLGAMRAFLESPEFDETVRRWTEEYGRDFDTTVEVAKRELLATNFRAEDVQLAQLIELLQAILRRLET